MMDTNSGFFTDELLIKIIGASCVWKNLVQDHAEKPLLNERVKCVRNGDDDGYKKRCDELESLEKRIFQSVHWKVKKAL